MCRTGDCPAGQAIHVQMSCSRYTFKSAPCQCQALSTPLSCAGAEVHLTSPHPPPRPDSFHHMKVTPASHIPTCPSRRWVLAILMQDPRGWQGGSSLRLGKRGSFDGLCKLSREVGRFGRCIQRRSAWVRRGVTRQNISLELGNIRTMRGCCHGWVIWANRLASLRWDGSYPAEALMRRGCKRRGGRRKENEREWMRTNGNH